jgi:hypothetical protein
MRNRSYLGMRPRESPRRPRPGAAVLLRLLVAAGAHHQVRAAHGDTDQTCAVSCVGKTFSGDSRKGEPVCGYEACGKATPFVGLETFGCSGSTSAFDGSCCNTATCDGWLAGHDKTTGASLCRTAGACEAADLARRTDEVVSVCCDEADAGCGATGMPSTCNEACADVVLAFVDDCTIALEESDSAEAFAPVVALCRGARRQGTGGA